MGWLKHPKLFLHSGFLQNECALNVSREREREAEHQVQPVTLICWQLISESITTLRGKRAWRRKLKWIKRDTLITARDRMLTAARKHRIWPTASHQAVREMKERQRQKGRWGLREEEGMMQGGKEKRERRREGSGEDRVSRLICNSHRPDWLITPDKPSCQSRYTTDMYQGFTMMRC